MAKYAQEILKISPMKLLNSDGSSFTVGATEQDSEKVVCLRGEREVKVEIIKQAGCEGQSYIWALHNRNLPDYQCQWKCF